MIIVKKPKSPKKPKELVFFFTWGAEAKGPSEGDQGREGTAKC